MFTATLAIAFAWETAVAQDCDGIPKPCYANPLPGATTMPGSDVPLPPDDSLSGLSRASSNAHLLYANARYADLDALINRYATLQDRLVDGRFKPSGIAMFLGEEYTFRPEGVLLTEVARWRAYNPKSPGAALLEAVYWRKLAWQARGGGYASSVTPEGWRLFRQRLERAKQTLSAAESYAASNPLWYEEYLDVSIGLGAPVEYQLAYYDRGIKAFPQYFPLHFPMIRALQPKWGGSYELIAGFIEAVVNRSPTAESAQLYTRLWWYVGQISPDDLSLFSDMGASWARMKDGFESLHARYPQSVWTLSNYASFACRAGDMRTYIRLKNELGAKVYKKAFPSNASIDVCDERAAGEPM
jgi:hypothetical protein